MKKYKILTVAVAMAAMFAFNPMSAKAANGDIVVQGQAYEVQDLDQYNTVNPIIAQKYEFDGYNIPDGVHKNLSPAQSFTLSEESVVVLKTSCTSNEGSNYVEAASAIYSDSTATTKVANSLKVRSNDKPTVNVLILKPGTYYVTVLASQCNGSGSGKAELTGIASASIAYIPLSKFYDIQQVQGDGVTTVNVKHHGGSFVKRLEYSPVYSAHAKINSLVWSYYSYDELCDGDTDDGEVFRLDPSLNGYVFDATEAGCYGVNALLCGDDCDDYCHAFTKVDVKVNSKAVKPEKKDTKKPTVTGVKNGKKYTKAVKIKFKDASGIKYAKLNKKNIKSGYKVKKSGKYKLTVVDKAGNKRIIKFRVSIPKKRR